MEMSWHEAILKVLRESKDPMHYSDIAQAIIDNGYRQNVGATPAATVAANLSTKLKSKVVRLRRGVYTLSTDSHAVPLTGDVAPQLLDEPHQDIDEAAQDAEQMGLINAFGMFWRRSEVDWSSRSPVLTGVQQTGSLASSLHA